MQPSRELPATGDEWRELRESHGLSRAELARRTAVDASTLWTLEHDGKVSMKVKLLVGTALGLELFPPVREAVPA